MIVRGKGGSMGKATIQSGDDTRSGASGVRRASARVLLAMLVAAAPAPLAAQGVPAPAEGQPRTAAELSGFHSHTSHAEMMAFLTELRARSPFLRLGTYGESREGRALPYVILSRPAVAGPQEAALLGRPVVLLSANVHGDERTLRESLLLMLREIATPGTPENALLDHMVILAAPQLNPDGFHASERGTRGNAWGIDLNRDYVKLAQPEIRSYVAFLHEWSPHLFVDGHNGGSRPYNLTYQCPSHASADARITQLCDDEIFPAVDRALEAVGYRSFYYTGGTASRWRTGGFQVRIGRNYGGLANMVGILFESEPRQGTRTGVESGYVAFRAVLEYVRDNGGRVVETVNRARRDALAAQLGADVVVGMEYGPEDRTVRYEIVVEENGRQRFVEVVSDSLMKRPIPTRTRPRPWAYVLPREATAAVELLRRHDIAVEQLRDSAVLDIHAYTVSGVAYERQYDHAAAVRVTVGETLSQRRAFPAGTYIVPLAQRQGRLAAHLLEPETDDNVIYWNHMDALLPRGPAAPAVVDDDEPQDARRRQAPEPGPPLVPIFKLMTPQPLPARLVEQR
jgi:dipeptidyl-peptidase 4